MPMKTLTIAGLLLAGTMLAGCVGGTTYGTGVSQEAQTVEDLANILSLRKKSPQIEYKPRADLVVPENKQLVDPEQVASVDENVDWPETPEERLARIRAEANEALSTTAGENEFSRQRKTVRGVAPGEGVQFKEAPIGQGVPDVSCDPNGVVMRQCTALEISRAVRAARAEIKSVGKTGYQRRYLTEPPVEYRTPSDGSVAGDLGYSEAELRAMEEARKAEERKNRFRGGTL